MAESPAWHCNTVRCKMFNPNIFYLPFMPAQIFGRCILPKFRFTFIKSVNIQNSLLRTWALGSHTQLKKMPMKIMRKSKHSICRFILILVGQILKLPNQNTVHFQMAMHDPDTNQKLKQRIFNNLKAGASVAIWHFNTQYMKNMTMVYPVKMECGWNFWLKVSFTISTRATMAGKTGKLLALPSFWVSMRNV